MAYIPKHAAGNRSGRPNGEVSEGAVEGTKAQPGLGGNLQRPAGEVSDDIGVADDDLKFVLGMGLELLLLLFHLRQVR